MPESRAKAIEIMANILREHFGSEAFAFAGDQAERAEGLAVTIWEAIAARLNALPAH